MESRFWAKVEKTDSCWQWLGAKRDGYGMFWKEGKIVAAHRVSWELAYGTISRGIQVLHRCDNRLCVKPSHLFLGTQADNLRDAVSKGHLNRVECGKLTPHPSRFKGWSWKQLNNKRVWIEPITAERL